MRLGFAVKVIGHGGNLATIPAEAGMPSNDARRWQSGPHVRQSIEYVREVFHYLHKVDIRMYRMSSDFVPYLTHPDMPQFHNQLEEAKDELADLGALARDYDIRLSLHPSQYILLNALDDEVARKSIVDLNAQAKLLDAMNCGPEAVVVTHVGGVYGEREESLARFIRRYKELPEETKRRLVVENDDVSYAVTDTLRVHEATGCPLVFDNLHHFCFNPEGLPMRDALRAVLATWPEGVTPKIHYSSPSTDFETTREKEKGATRARPDRHEATRTLAEGSCRFYQPLGVRPVLGSCGGGRPAALRHHAGSQGERRRAAAPSAGTCTPERASYGCWMTG